MAQTILETAYNIISKTSTLTEARKPEPMSSRTRILDFANHNDPGFLAWKAHTEDHPDFSHFEEKHRPADYGFDGRGYTGNTGATSTMIAFNKKGEQLGASYEHVHPTIKYSQPPVTKKKK